MTTFIWMYNTLIWTSNILVREYSEIYSSHWLSYKLKTNLQSNYIRLRNKKQIFSPFSTYTSNYFDSLFSVDIFIEHSKKKCFEEDVRSTYFWHFPERAFGTVVFRWFSWPASSEMARNISWSHGKGVCSIIMNFEHWYWYDSNVL